MDRRRGPFCWDFHGLLPRTAPLSPAGYHCTAYCVFLSLLSYPFACSPLLPSLRASAPFGSLAGACVSRAPLCITDLRSPVCSVPLSSLCLSLETLPTCLPVCVLGDALSVSLSLSLSLPPLMRPAVSVVHSPQAGLSLARPPKA